MTVEKSYEKYQSRVHYVSWSFWESNSLTLARHGLTWKDVKQQAWVEFMLLKREWPTNPTRFLKGRLIDWMRHETSWTKSTRTPAPFTVSFEYHEDMNNPKLGCNDEHWHPPAKPVDFEAGEVIQKLRSHSQQQGLRTGNIMNAYIEGDTMKEIGKRHNISEGRVCQIIKGVVAQVRQTVFAVAAVCLVAVPAWGQETVPEMIGGCSGVSWQANPEEDLAGYQIFVNKDGVQLDPVDVAKTETTYPCSRLPITEGATYGIQMTAFDTSGNVSEPSSVVAFTWPDTTAPATPISMCIAVVVNGKIKELCLTIN